MPDQRPNSIRVVLVDDQQIIREALSLLLSTWRDIAVVAEAATQAEALDVVASFQPDVIVLKLYLGGQIAIPLIPDLLSVAPKSRLLVLTGIADPERHRRAVRAGAMGVVLRDQPPSVLVSAIRRVYAGEVWLDPTMIARLIAEIANPSNSHALNPETAKISAITGRELQVLALVCQGLHNKEIGARLEISESTVRHHLSAMYEKLGVTGRLELVIYANHHGIIGSAAVAESGP